MRFNSVYLFLLSLLFACADKAASPAGKTASTTISPVILKPGGVYLIRNPDSSFRLVKVLVLDEYAVHARYYADTFRVKPDSGISTENLKLAIGHAPVDKNGFLAGQPELLKVEKVNETELEGYRIYQEAMGN